MTDDARKRFAEVVLPQADRAYRLALWLTRSRDDAEDVVQDAALRAFQAIGGFSGSNPRAWFLTIVRRTAFTWLAKNRPNLHAVNDPEEMERCNPGAEPAFGADVPATPEAVMLARQRCQSVREAVEALPVHFREAIVMREMEELSYREIAAILDVPLGTVISRLSRARALLAETLAEERP